MTTFKNILFIAVAALAVLFATVNNLHAPPSIPGSKDVLSNAEIVPVKGAMGPESLAFDLQGRGPYTGVADGRILRWEGYSRGWSDFAFTSSQREECVRPFAPELEEKCGRPLGLMFHNRTGDLYIADAYLGLKVVGPQGGLATSLVSELDGRPFLFLNHMDIDHENDVIYFTDSSTIFQRRNFLASTMTGDSTGRLLRYNIVTKEVTVLLEGLAFANGVSLSKDGSFVLVAETNACRIQRLWLKGPSSGNSEIFAELPGFPDNIRRNEDGEFWVALHSKPNRISKLAINSLWFRNMLMNIPLSPKKLQYMVTGGRTHATAMKLSEDGKVSLVLEDCDGKAMKFLSEVEEHDGKLWLGSVLMPFMGIYELPDYS